MKETVIFVSPLSPQDCNQRLDELAKKRNLYFASKHFVIHINIKALETKRDSFKLSVSCSPQRFEFPAFVFFILFGQIHPAETGTTIQLRLQLSKPFSKFELGYLVFWLLILALAITGGVIGVLSSNLLHGSFIVLAFVATSIGYAWILYQTYKLGMVKILDLVYKALRQEPHENSKGQESKTPDWVSSLSESQ